MYICEYVTKVEFYVNEIKDILVEKCNGIVECQ